MAACEACWSAAFIDSMALGGFQADHYRERIARNACGAATPTATTDTTETEEKKR